MTAIQPSVRMGISDLSGTIKGLSSKQLARADVDLAGRVDKVAPLKIIGTINPLSEEAFTDLAITFENMDLTDGGPYSGKYVGYNLSKGKLSFNLKYKISQKQLEAENSIVVDQLTFGEKTNSPGCHVAPGSAGGCLASGPEGTDRNRFADSRRSGRSRLQVREGRALDLAQSPHENRRIAFYLDWESSFREAEAGKSCNSLSFNQAVRR